MEPVPTALVGDNDDASKLCTNAGHGDGVHSQDAGGWVQALAVATFDVGTGHKLEQVYPQDSLDDGDRQRIRMLAMPDCNTTQMGDCFYCFRTRKSHRLPLLSSSLLEQTFEYCYAFFRQEKNNECARGMFQKSVVLVSRYPYVNLYERLMKVIGPLYFAHGPAVLEAVFASVEEWPAPCPGALCPLPFLSETIMFQVPEIDMPPQVASKYKYHRGTHTCSLWPRERIRSLSRTMSGCGSGDFASSSSNPSIRTVGDGFSAAYIPGTGKDGDTLINDPAAASEERVSAGDTMGPPESRVGVERHALELWRASGHLTKATSFADVDRNTSDHSGGEHNPGMIGKSCESGAMSSPTSTNRGNTDVHLCPSDGAFVNKCLSEHGTEAAVSIWKREDEKIDCGKLGSDGDAEKEVSRCSVWSGTARSPGVLVTPGLHGQTGGLGGDGCGAGDEKRLVDRVSAQRRSSLGSRSLASVVSNSPSESWLTTPKNAGSPLMVLDSNCGSNLAQSCYYVADRDSEDDDEISIPNNGEEEADSDNGDRPADAVDTYGHFVFERWRDNPQRSGEVDAGSQHERNQDTRESMALSGLVTVESPRKAAARRDQSPVGRDPSCQIPVGNPVDSIAGASNRLNPQVARSVTHTTNEASLTATSPSVSEQFHATDNRRAGERRMDPEMDRGSSPRELAESSTSDVQDIGPGGPTDLSPIHQSAASREDSIFPPPSPELSSMGGGLKSEGSLILKASAVGVVSPTLTPGGGYPKFNEWAGLRAWAESAPDNPLDAPPPLSSPLVARSRSTNNSPGRGKLVGVDPSSPKRETTAGVPESDLVSGPSSAQALSPGRRGKDRGVKANIDYAVSSVGGSKTELAAEESDGEKGMQAPKFSSPFSSVTHLPAGKDDEACQSVSSSMLAVKETTHEVHDQRQGEVLSSLRSSSPIRPPPERVGDSFARDVGRGWQTPNGEGTAQAAGGVLELVGDGGRTGSVSPKSRIGYSKSSPTRVPASQRHRQGAKTSDAAGDDVGVDEITSTLGKCSVNVHNRSAGHVISPRACAREVGSDKDRAVPVGTDADHDPSPDADTEKGASGFHVGRGKVEADGGDLTPGSMVADGNDEKAGVVAGKRASKSEGRPPSFRKKSFRLNSDQRSLSRKGKQDKRSIHIHHTASTLQGGRSPFAEMLLADEARFRAKQGLFQSIGLYSIFGRKLVEHLWLLWELVLTGGPTLIVGSNVGASSAAILGMVSLASPVFFGGDFRPHFTTFDPDYRDIVAAHDRLTKQQPWGSSVLGVPGAGSGTDATGGFPSMLLGVINPIFLRTLSRWPNAIVLPGAAGRSQGPNTSSESINACASRKLQKRLSEDSTPESPRNRHCPTPKMEGTSPLRPPPVRVQVIRAGASLEQVVGQDERPDEPIIVCRQQPVMLPDAGVLSRLLDPSCPYNPATAAAAAAEAAAAEKVVPEGSSAPPTPSSAGIAAMAAKAAAAARGGLETRGQWKDSLRAINDVILRRHFAHLTRSFLSPFDKYFRPSRAPPHLSPWQQQALARLSVYTEAELLLCKFDEEEFLSEMGVVGPPKSFAHVQWQTLYRRFMESPNFRPWFTTQRMEGIERIREFNRAVCLRTTAAALVEACAPAKLPMLLAKIKRAIAREWGLQPSDVDWELLERMEMHQAAVEAAVSSLSSSTPAGSAQP